MTTASDALHSAQQPTDGSRPLERAGAEAIPVRTCPAPVERAFDPPQKGDRFVTVGSGFEVEYAGPFIRIWHATCRNSDLLPDDEEGTVTARKAVHRCGERISPWGSGENKVRP